MEMVAWKFDYETMDNSLVSREHSRVMIQQVKLMDDECDTQSKVVAQVSLVQEHVTLEGETVIGKCLLILSVMRKFCHLIKNLIPKNPSSQDLSPKVNQFLKLKAQL
ncbi:hypothetical protein TURU_016303 [Turdus rufiventris]|nr:hypothetical protein TURU_016303 [Turdus rufiventris]